MLGQGSNKIWILAFLGNYSNIVCWVSKCVDWGSHHHVFLIIKSWSLPHSLAFHGPVHGSSLCPTWTQPNHFEFLGMEIAADWEEESVLLSWVFLGICWLSIEVREREDLTESTCRNEIPLDLARSKWIWRNMTKKCSYQQRTTTLVGWRSVGIGFHATTY